MRVQAWGMPTMIGYAIEAIIMFGGYWGISPADGTKSTAPVHKQLLPWSASCHSRSLAGFLPFLPSTFGLTSWLTTVNLLRLPQPNIPTGITTYYPLLKTPYAYITYWHIYTQVMPTTASSNCNNDNHNNNNPIIQINQCDSSNLLLINGNNPPQYMFRLLFPLPLFVLILYWWLKPSSIATINLLNAWNPL